MDTNPPAMDRRHAMVVAESGTRDADRRIRLSGDDNRWWRILALGGMAMGLMGSAIGIAGLLLWDPPPPEFIRVSEDTGRVLVSVPARDAPTLFTKDTSRQYLGMLVERCEQYTHPLALQMSRQCAALLSPPVQASYAQHFNGPDGPVASLRYGGSSVARNLSFGEVAADPRHRSESWRVYYDLTRRLENGTESCRRMVLSVQWVWRPELKMDQDTRRANPAGMQVLQYTNEEDRGQKCRV